MLTIRHITFGLSIDPFQNMLTVQGYFGMAFEYTTHGLGPLIYLLGKKKKTFRPVDGDHHFCLVTTEDDLWPMITFTGVSASSVVYIN